MYILLFFARMHRMICTVSFRIGLKQAFFCRCPFKNVPYDRTPITLLLLLFEKKLTNKINCNKINNKKEEFHKFNTI